MRYSKGRWKGDDDLGSLIARFEDEGDGDSAELLESMREQMEKHFLKLNQANGKLGGLSSTLSKQLGKKNELKRALKMAIAMTEDLLKEKPMLAAKIAGCTTMGNTLIEMKQVLKQNG